MAVGDTPGVVAGVVRAERRAWLWIKDVRRDGERLRRSAPASEKALSQSVEADAERALPLGGGEIGTFAKESGSRLGGPVAALLDPATETKYDGDEGLSGA